MRHNYYLCDKHTDRELLKKYRHAYVIGNDISWSRKIIFTEFYGIDENYHAEDIERAAAVIIRNPTNEDLTFLTLAGLCKKITTDSMTHQLTSSLWGKHESQ